MTRRVELGESDFTGRKFLEAFETERGEKSGVTSARAFMTPKRGGGTPASQSRQAAIGTASATADVE